MRAPAALRCDSAESRPADELQHCRTAHLRAVASALLPPGCMHAGALQSASARHAGANSAALGMRAPLLRRQLRLRRRRVRLRMRPVASPQRVFPGQDTAGTQHTSAPRNVATVGLARSKSSAPTYVMSDWKADRRSSMTCRGRVSTTLGRATAWHAGALCRRQRLQATRSCSAAAAGPRPRGSPGAREGPQSR